MDTTYPLVPLKLIIYVLLLSMVSSNTFITLVTTIDTLNIYSPSKGRLLESKNNTIQRVTPNKYYTLYPTSNKFSDNIYLGSTLISTIDTSSTNTPALSYTLTNHLNSTVLTVDNTGSITSTTDYTPYGSERLQTGIQSNRKYIGETYDSDTGLNYLNARYYNSNQGQFISQDPVFWELKQNLADPQSLNSYSYSNNNPINGKDPDGRCSTLSNCAGQAVGGAQAAGGMIVGIATLVAAYNPITPIVAPQFTEQVSNGIVEGVKNVPSSISQTYQDYKNGNDYTRGKIEGSAAVTVASMFLGGEGVVVKGGGVVETSGYNVAKAISSLEKQIAKHELKLENYRKDPLSGDNKNLLSNPENSNYVQKIVNGRINKLQNEIQKFKNEINKLKN